ncbi:DbpA RNA binding domain-containing protein, partial [Microbacterium sp.]|uniref:DbpA RNA binding domain-containing protein n=1 Tax=Microbacterium sp. TaxID=51671 RepID=UPI002635F4DC
ITLNTPRARYQLKHIDKPTRHHPTQMQQPTTEDVNTTRLARFDDAITAALGAGDRIEKFRDIIAHYVRNHDVPEADVAAALAVVAQGDTPLLLDPETDALTAAVARDNRPPREGRDRPAREPRERRGRSDYAPYRIEVGRRHRVEPRQIVGALANEGGLGRDDFGAINIKPDFSIVELPATMDAAVLEKLRDTRISGRLIEIKPDRGPRGGARRDGDRGGHDRRRRDDRSFRDDRPARKPRHKS